MTEKRRAILILVALTILDGAVAQFFVTRTNASVLLLVMVFLTSFMLFVWYRLDARDQSYKRTWPLNFGVAGASLVAMPYYLFRTRGARGGALATLLFFLGLVGLAVASILGSLFGYLVFV